jgi:hypothetical protein
MAATDDFATIPAGRTEFHNPATSSRTLSAEIAQD